MALEQVREWEKRKLPCKIREEKQESNSETEDLRTQLIHIIEKLATNNPLDLLNQEGTFSLQLQKKQQNQKDLRKKIIRTITKNTFDNQSTSSGASAFENGNVSSGVPNSKFHRHSSISSLKKLYLNSSSNSAISASSPLHKKYSLHRSMSSLSLSNLSQVDETLDDDLAMSSCSDGKATARKTRRKKSKIQSRHEIARRSQSTISHRPHAENSENRRCTPSPPMERSSHGHTHVKKSEQHMRSITEETKGRNSIHHKTPPRRRKTKVKKQKKTVEKKFQKSKSIYLNNNSKTVEKSKNTEVLKERSFHGEAKELNLFG